MSVCDKQCEGCPYSDCINDEMDLDDYREADARDRALGTVRKAKDPPPVGGDTAKKEAARERARAKAREYNKAHRAELREYYKKWRAENPDARRRNITGKIGSACWRKRGPIGRPIERRSTPGRGKDITRKREEKQRENALLEEKKERRIHREQHQRR